MKKLNMVMTAVLVAMVAYSAYGQSTVTSFAVPALVDQINVIVAAAEGRLDDIEDGTTLPLLTDGRIIVGNSGGTGEAFAVTGDITLSNAGVVAIAADAIVNADVNPSAAIAHTKLSGVAAAPAVVGSVATTTNTVTATATDGAGATLAARRLVRVWVSEAAFGVPSTNNIESVTLSGGTAIQTVSAAADYVYLTADTGIASAVVVGTAAGTNYIQVADGGYVTSAAVVFE